MGQIAVDTTFLIDWQREAGRQNGPVTRFLRAHTEDRFYMSLTVLGEFSAGFADLGALHYRKVREGLGLLPNDEEVALVYRTVFRDLKSRGCLIGANDLWIAAAALRHGMPLVTRNVHEFERVPGLALLGY
jgi:predicted nucleic acid-binding protein